MRASRWDAPRHRARGIPGQYPGGWASCSGGSEVASQSWPRAAPWLQPVSGVAAGDWLEPPSPVRRPTRFWRRLSVFSDGFTLEAAQQVAGVAPIGPSAVPGLVGDLVDQSMVVFQPAADRYRLLEVLRDFARTTGEADEEGLIAGRHRRRILGLADGCDDRWFGPDQAGLIERMHVEVGIFGPPSMGAAIPMPPPACDLRATPSGTG